LNKLKKIKLIYILGAGHSGSTLLDHLLSSHSMIESGGELYKYLPYVSDTLSVRPYDNRFCSCGEHINDCGYWKTIKDVVATKHGTFEVDLLNDTSEKFGIYNKDVIEEMLKTSGKVIFCDSSKKLTRLEALIQCSLFDVYVVHLVRDGRAVGYSHYKKGHSFLTTVRRWKRILDRHGEWIKHWSKPERCITLRYEDLVDNPSIYLEKIVKMVGLKFEPEQLQFRKGEHHILSGNRMRWSKNQEIKRDKSYIKKISWYQWNVANIVFGRVLKQFGYSLSKRE